MPFLDCSVLLSERERRERRKCGLALLSIVGLAASKFFINLLLITCWSRA